MKKERPLPFRRNFMLGIAAMFLAKFLSTTLSMEWILYVGGAIGLTICIVDVFKALKNMP